MSDSAFVLGFMGGGLESFGQALALRVGVLNFWTAVLVAAAFMLDRVFAQRMRASLRIALYAPIVLRVVLPLDWAIQLTDAQAGGTLFAPLAQIGAQPLAADGAGHAPSWYALFALVYFAVAAALTFRTVRARLHLRRELRSVEVVSLAHQGLRYPVLAHSELGPMAVGLLAPRIVVPTRLLAAGQEHALACVLNHEAAHLQRRDPWLSTGLELLLIAAWPVLPLWVAGARVRHLIEVACDEAALAHADANERRRYGHVLLDMAEWRNLPTLAGQLHFGSTLRARIEALASQRHWSALAQSTALSLATLVLILACGSSGVAPGAAPQTSAAAQPATDKDAPSKDATGYGYEFDVDAASATSAPPTSAPTLHDGGRLSPEAIQGTVRAHFGELWNCYAAGLQQDPKLAGTVTVRFVLQADGTTSAAADEGSTLPDQEVVACAVGVFQKLQYPKSHGGHVTVVYPIKFGS